MKRAPSTKRTFNKALTLRLDSSDAVAVKLSQRLNAQLDSYPASFRPKPMKLGLHFLTVGLEVAERAFRAGPMVPQPAYENVRRQSAGASARAKRKAVVL